MIDFPQTDLPRSVRGGSDVWDQPQASVILADDYFPSTGTIVSATGTADGTATASASGQSIVAASGASSGLGLAAADGSAITSAQGSTQGQGVATGAGSAVNSSVGSSQGQSSAAASGGALTAVRTDRLPQPASALLSSRLRA